VRGTIAGQAVYSFLRVLPWVLSRSVLPMNEVTRILHALEQGDPHAAEQRLPLVYQELRRLAAVHMAQEKPGADARRHRPGS
jgi:hypothetical protein